MTLIKHKLNRDHPPAWGLIKFCLCKILNSSDKQGGLIIKMLQGKYSLQPDLHNGHVLYKMHGHPHFIYYSNYYSRWVINQEINERFTHIVSLMGDVACPTDSKYWTWWNTNLRRWSPVPDVEMKCVGDCDLSDDHKCEAKNNPCHEMAHCSQKGGTGPGQKKVS